MGQTILGVDVGQAKWLTTDWERCRNGHFAIGLVLVGRLALNSALIQVSESPFMKASTSISNLV